ncbi:putative cytochrome c oxidase subunit 6b-like [Neltuma alba]|uniref:putative cytochrome c oxidase subunit 6b-like n=1 Tax=Neltuma alba TaxID=207710 RepID=UPI0010A4F528|nr:putative cytochrome c oxidase subunit 6b-like [Prosopis alba]
MSASQVDPRDRTRARDVSKVTRGEQAPRPAHEYGTVSPPPPPSSTDHININTNKNKEEKSGKPQTDYQTRHCYVRYVDYHRCILQKGKKDPECEKLETYYRKLCPTEWVSKWDEEREGGAFPGDV